MSEKETTNLPKSDMTQPVAQTVDPAEAETFAQRLVREYGKGPVSKPPPVKPAPNTEPQKVRSLQTPPRLAKLDSTSLKQLAGKHAFGLGFSVVAFGIFFAGHKLIWDSIGRHETIKAEEYLTQENYSNALLQTEIALKFVPENGQLHQVRGKIFYRTKEWTKARDEYAQVIKTDPNNLKVLDKLASVCLKLGDYQQAIDCYEKIYETDASFFQPYQYGNRAIAYSALGDYPRAISDYEAALRDKPGDVQFLMGDAFCNSQLAKYIQAITECNGVLEHQPKDKEALLLKGWCQQRLKQYDSALKNYKLAQAVAPSDARPYYYEGGFWEAQNNEQKALAAYNKAVEVDPHMTQAYRARAAIYLRKKMISEAIKDLQRENLDAKNLSPDFYVQLSTLLLSQNRASEALETTTRGLKNFADNDQLLLAHGRAMYLLKDYASSLADCKAALLLNSRNPQALIQRGMCNAKLGNKVTAISDFCAAIKLADKSINAHLERGKYYVAEQAYDSAIADFDKVLKLDPPNNEATKLLQFSEAMIKKRSKITLDLPKQFVSKYSGGKLKNMSDSALLEKGYQLLNEGQTQDAVAVLSESVRRQPDNANARRYLATAFGAMGEVEEAVKQYDALVSMNSISPQDSSNEAQLLNEHGGHDRAIQLYRQVLDKQPDDERAQLGLTQAYASSNQIDKAIDLCKVAANQKHSPAFLSKMRNLLASLQQQNQKQTETKTQKKAPTADIGG